MDRPIDKNQYGPPWSEVIPLSMEAVLDNGSGGNIQNPEQDPEQGWDDNP